MKTYEKLADLFGTWIWRITLGMSALVVLIAVCLKFAVGLKGGILLVWYVGITVLLWTIGFIAVVVKERNTNLYIYGIVMVVWILVGCILTITMLMNW